MSETRQAIARGETLKLFSDEFRSPIPASDTARAVWELVKLNKPGLYHLAGSERLSRWEIGRLLARRWEGMNPKCSPFRLKILPARRDRRIRR